MENKHHIDTYLQQRSKDLELYFNRFCLPNEKGQFGEMLSELYLHLIENSDKLTDWITKDELHYYCIKFIYNQRNWSKTKYKKMTSIPEQIQIDSNIDYGFDPDEMTSMEGHYEKEVKLNQKLELLQNALSHLDYYERYVYNEYFIKKKTLRGLASDVGLSHIAIHKIVNRIKNKLQSIIKKQIVK